MDVHFCFLLISLAMVQGDPGDPMCFNNSFGFGVATASYQIEGAWNVSGKGESIWDRYTHEHPNRVFDHNNGDVADDSYHHFKKDVELMDDLGVHFYRFSISWSRILPDGLSNNINQDGIRYYKELLSELQSRHISAVVTMYHWDLPQKLQDLGGWTNPIIVDYFVDYARILFDSFGDRVMIWITFNEPNDFCPVGYGGYDAPGGNSSGFQDYMCAHNVLLAHARAYELYDKEYRHKYHGKIGITCFVNWNEPNTTSEEDKMAAETAMQFTFGWFMHPIFSKEGDYPPIMRRRIDTISAQQGFPRSRLPTFTQAQVRLIKGSFDIMGVNHYTTHVVAQGNGKFHKTPSYDEDMGVLTWQRANWPKSNSTWLRVVPWGFRRALNWVRKTYDNPIVLITENGVSQESGTHDPKRLQYISSYLKALHGAISDGCNVVGYTYWSLMDNFEWMRGYSEKFGLYAVDYESPNRTRTARLSAKFYSKVAKTRCIPEDFVDLYTVTGV